MSLPVVVVSKLPQAEALAAIREELAGIADVAFLPDLDPERQAVVLREARAAMTYHPWRDLGPECLAQLTSCELLQCMTAGIDYLPLRDLPKGLPVAYNAGAFAEPMAEHVLAMALAGAKRLRGGHLEMQAGAFNQFVATKQVRGAVCGILGFGETGRAVARLLRPIGLRLHAINRSGRTDEDVEFVGTLDDVGEVLDRSDFVVVTLALTTKTDGLIDAAALSRMKDDAVLINVARGEIVDEDALYAHLLGNPRFIACLEAWWIEPVRHGRFETRHDFLSLPNVIGSPHNSAMVPDALIGSARQAARNVRRLLTGEGARYIAGDDVKMN
jgi:phosphoglycerate dehydrogenase-like enzyme